MESKTDTNLAFQFIIGTTIIFAGFVIVYVLLIQFGILGSMVNDFTNFWADGYLAKINLLYPYNYNITIADFYAFPFRYLPSCLFLAEFFTNWNYTTAYIIYEAICIFANAINILLLVRIFRQVKVDAKFHKTILIAYSISFLWTLTAGNISQLVSLCVITGLYLFLNNRANLGMFVLGLSIILKPVTFFIPLFIIIYDLFFGNEKFFNILKKVACLLIVFIPDVYLFLTVNNLLSVFIQINLITYPLVTPIPVLSFAGILESYGANQTWTTIISAIIAMCFGIFILSKMKYSTNQTVLLFCFWYGVASLFVAYGEIWPSQLVFFVPCLIANCRNTKYGNKLLKCILYFEFCNSLYWDTLFGSGPNYGVQIQVGKFIAFSNGYMLLYVMPFVAIGLFFVIYYSVRLTLEGEEWK
jgi:hypothetical protein